MKYYPNRLNQIKWSFILMGIGLFGLAFYWFAENYGNIPFIGDKITIIISGGTLLLGILALIGKVVMEVEENVLSKRLFIAGMQAFEFSFSPDEIADVTLKDGCDIHFTLIDGRKCAFDNLNKEDAEELFGILKIENENKAE